MYVKSGELGNDMAKLLVKGLLGVLDLPHIKITNATNGISLVDNCWGLSLRLRQHNVEKVAEWRNSLDGLKVILTTHIR